MVLLIIHLIAVNCLGAILFLAIDKYEHDPFVGNLLKLFVLTLGSLAILHKLLPLFGIEF
jgi:transcriptional regulator with XRE-family HTH domain